MNVLFNVLFGRFKIFSLWGVPCFVSTTALLLVLLLAGFDRYAGLVVTLSYLSIVPHEYGHVWAARVVGLRATEVSMTVIGGMASIRIPPFDHKKELAVTVAGPAVNLTIAALSMAASMALTGHDEAADVATLVASINVFLFAVNMIPAFPLDGGRVLRATLGMLVGGLTPTVVAVRISHAVSAVAIIAGAVIGNPLVIGTFVFLIFVGQAELWHTRNLWVERTAGEKRD